MNTTIPISQATLERIFQFLCSLKRLGYIVPPEEAPFVALFDEVQALRARHATVDTPVSAMYLGAMEQNLAECLAHPNADTDPDIAAEIADLRAGIAAAKASRKGL
jgi:hypothetical protein